MGWDLVRDRRGRVIGREVRAGRGPLEGRTNLGVVGVEVAAGEALEVGGVEDGFGCFPG